jgi:hypothetical protein
MKKPRQCRAPNHPCGIGQGRACMEGVRALLQPVYDQFDEGLDTADLKSAAGLLATLR